MHPEHISQSGINLIKSFEGLHKLSDDGLIHSYRCSAGRWTIGYGSTKGVRSGQRITEQEAEDKLKQDVVTAENDVKRHIKVPLSQNQFDALCSFAFNCGGANLGKSTLTKLVNKGKYDEASEQFLRWNKARVNGELTILRGLTRRRTAEAALFNMDAQLPAKTGEIMPQKIEQKATKPLIKSKTMVGTGVAGAATGLNEIAGQIQMLLPYASSLKVIFLVCALGGIGLAAWARYSDHRKGER